MGGFHDYSADFGDIFEDLLSGFGFSTGRRSRKSPRRGRDLQMQVTLTFEEAVFGVEKDIEFTREETCSRCNGNGAEPGTSPVKCSTCNGVGEVRQVRQTFLGQMVQTGICPNCNGRGEMISSPCKTCHGNGLERKKVRKKVQIPAGVDTGTQIRLASEGGPGENGGPQGSLYLVLDVKPHQFFKRRENDIILNLDINIAQAVLGAEISVPTIDGEEKLKIPAGTQPGKVFHLRGKGVPHVRSKNQRGDELVLVNVAIPSKLTKEQRQLFEQLAESLGTTVKPQEKGFLDWLNEALGG
jgi:molecular chaperone DnaJ